MPAKQPPRVDDPGYWRFRAANTRELAKESTDEMSKTLAKIAESYDALAQSAEERRRRKQEDQPSGGRKDNEQGGADIDDSKPT
jgi:hypothetical protein